jgi:hypothetical protein
MWADGVVYAEVRYCPALHLQQGLSPDEVHRQHLGPRRCKDDVTLKTQLLSPSLSTLAVIINHHQIALTFDSHSVAGGGGGRDRADAL